MFRMLGVLLVLGILGYLLPLGRPWSSGISRVNIRRRVALLLEVCELADQ